MDMDDVWWMVRWIGGPIALVALGVAGCVNSAWYRDGQIKEAAQDAEDAQPRVIREIDGCKVYAFKSGRWHYFTRCPAQTTTESSWVERHGKTSSVESETIITTNK